LSEDTDALAVVVSEETGTISLVQGGQIRRDLDGRSLKQALLDGLGGKVKHEHPVLAPTGSARER
jgi:diadenylate cyclase